LLYFSLDFMLKKYMLSSLTVEQNKNAFPEQDAQGTMKSFPQARCLCYYGQDAHGTIKALRLLYVFTE
jgi:hypothetical protein